jgi:S1-C subfamily serine protease
MRRFAFALALLVGGLAALAPAQPPRAAAPAAIPAAAPAAPAHGEPKYINDDEMYEQFFNKLEDLAKAKKPLAHEKLMAKLKPCAAGITPARPGTKALAPEDVFRTALQSVFVVGSVYPDKDSKWQTGTYATAWVLAADGVLVTNWHVFEDLKDDEVFGAADHNGTVYPLTDFLGGDKTADVAVFRIAATDLKPLPVATGHAEVGSWVGVISHPGDLFYLYTQGTVTRYSTNTNDDKQVEKWMGITAEYASGSSGSPVLNKYGAVVGMASLTLSLDANDDPKKPARRPRPPVNPKQLSRADQPRDEKKDDKKDDKPKEPPKPGDNQKGSPQQMVVRMAVPGPVLLKWIGK